MSRSNDLFSRRLGGMLAALGAMFLSQQSLAATQCVNQGAPAPLEICVQDNGTPGVWVQQPSGRRYQYYGEYGWGSAIRLGNSAGQTYSTTYFSGSPTIPVSNTRTGSGTAADPYIITTVVALGTSDVTLTQRFRYVDGDRNFGKSWTFANTGTTTHEDLRFFHGGDTYFGGDDSARSWYDDALRMVYVNNSSFSDSGYMAFYANPLTPISHYFAGSYSTGRNQVNAGALDDTYNSAFLDAGYYLQWNRDVLRPGETWRIEAFETWSPPGSLQVLTPGDEYATAGATVRKMFKVHNLDASSTLSVTLSASTASGWNLSMPRGTTATLGPLEVIEVPVDVQVPAGVPAGARASIALAATDGALNTMTGTTRVSVPSTDYAFSTRMLDFGTGTVGASSELVLTFTNGSDAVSIGEVGASNGLAAPFSIVGDTCSNATLAANAVCTITVRFSPVTGAEFSDSFGLPIGGEALVNETITLSGTAIDQIPVAALAGSGGSITPATRTVTPGQPAAFTVTPDTGYRIAAVTGCAGTLAGNVYTTAAVTGACTVAATFERIVFTLGAGHASGGSIVLSTPSVQHGDTASFVITPAYGRLIGTVSGCPGTLSGNTFTTAPLTAACTLSATFVDEISTVTVRGRGEGGGGSTGWPALGGLLLLALRRLRRGATLTAAGVAAAGMASTAAAQAGEPAVADLHVGAMFAAARSSESGRDIGAALQAQGHAVTADVDDGRMAWRVHGGWSMNRHLALEVGYSDLGEVTTGFAGEVPVLAIDGLLAAALPLQPRTANGFDLSLAARHELAFVRGLSVQARVGVFRWDAQRSVGTSDGRSVIEYADGANLLLGAGLGYRLTQQVEVTAEWMRHAMGSANVQATGVGIRYRW